MNSLCVLECHRENSPYFFFPDRNSACFVAPGDLFGLLQVHQDRMLGWTATPALASNRSTGSKALPVTPTSCPT